MQVRPFSRGVLVIKVIFVELVVYRQNKPDDQFNQAYVPDESSAGICLDNDTACVTLK